MCVNGNTNPLIPIKKVFSLLFFFTAAKSSALTQSKLEHVQLRLKSEFRMTDPEIEQDSHKEFPCTLGSQMGSILLEKKQPCVSNFDDLNVLF